MMPKRVIHERKQSHPAYCEHRSDVGLLDCSNECKLIITVAPLALGYDFLIVDRCPDHLHASYGVLGEEHFRIDERGDYHVW